MTGTRLRTGSLGRRLHALAGPGGGRRPARRDDVSRAGQARARGLPGAARCHRIGARLDVGGDRAGYSTWLQLLHLAARIRHPGPASWRRSPRLPAPCSAGTVASQPRAPAAGSTRTTTSFPGWPSPRSWTGTPRSGPSRPIPVDVPRHLGLVPGSHRAGSQLGDGRLAAARLRGGASCDRGSRRERAGVPARRLARSRASSSRRGHSSPISISRRRASTPPTSPSPSPPARPWRPRSATSTEPCGYRRSSERALEFMADARAPAPRSGSACATPPPLGGVRLNTLSSEVRIDYVSHTLFAHLRVAEAVDAGG